MPKITRSRLDISELPLLRDSPASSLKLLWRPPKGRQGAARRCSIERRWVDSRIGRAFSVGGAWSGPDSVGDQEREDDGVGGYSVGERREPLARVKNREGRRSPSGAWQGLASFVQDRAARECDAGVVLWIRSATGAMARTMVMSPPFRILSETPPGTLGTATWNGPGLTTLVTDSCALIPLKGERSGADRTRVVCLVRRRAQIPTSATCL